jgi:hypothetical protein
VKDGIRKDKSLENKVIAFPRETFKECTFELDLETLESEFYLPFFKKHWFGLLKIIRIMLFY